MKNQLGVTSFCRLKPAKRTPPNTGRNKSSNTQRTENKTTDVVIHQHSRRLLKMDILMSETSWAHNKWNNIASDTKLVFHSSASWEILKLQEGRWSRGYRQWKELPSLLPHSFPFRSPSSFFFIHFVSTLIFVGLKRPWCEIDDSLPSSAEVKICVSNFLAFKCSGS